MDKYLVYAHIRPDTDEIFYIGKGTKKRSIDRSNRNRYWKNIVNKCQKFKSIILAGNLTEKEALNYEILMIKKLKEIGVSLCNMTLGGDGLSGYKHTEETKHHLSKIKTGKVSPTKGTKASEETRLKQRFAKLGKPRSDKAKEAVSKGMIGRKFSQETRDKISKANLGNKLSKEHIEKLSKKIICISTNIIYPSAREAARQLHLYPANISKCCNGQLNKTGGLQFKFYQGLTK